MRAWYKKSPPYTAPISLTGVQLPAAENVRRSANFMRSQVNRFTFCRSLLLALALISCIASPALGQTGLVISQIYGGGGNSGATYKYDYIELYNGTSGAMDLSTYSIQYASAAGTSWSVVNLSGTVQPSHYFLLRGCTGNNSSTAPDLPVTPDFSYP